MNESLQLHTGLLSLELERQVDELCDEFEDALKRGVVPNPDEYLGRIHESAHPQLRDELAKLLRGYTIADRQSLSTSAPVTSAVSNKLDAVRADDLAAEPATNTKVHIQQSLEIMRQIDDAGAKFAEALDRGELLSIEETVAAAAPETRQMLLRELLNQEMQFRSKKGENPPLEQYRGRFPDRARLVKYLYFENFVPEKLGEFSIQKLVGRGGFGHVYQGWDAKLSRNVAIKVFRRDPDRPSPPGGGLLFEARMAAQLRHPGIVAVYAVLPDLDGDEFLVLEFVDGTSLEDLLRSSKLSPREAADLLLAVVQALQHSHQHGLVHRDLKPANILLDHGRVPRVTDFGLALHLTDLRRSPDVAGTLPYMAPEQAGGETHRLDARTDLWAVGVTFYRMLSGRLPFSGGNPQELLDAIRNEEPEDLLLRQPSIPPEVIRIVRKCMAKRMSERYQSAAELADDLSAFLIPSTANRHADGPSDDVLTSRAVVPKGIRCFDSTDREFFLQLVPGPRDRHGVPSEVRFWESRLRELDVNQTFRVGLLYGPSGSGKSSLVRAGILPQLPGNVRPLLIQATRDETELGLMRQLRRHFPELPQGLTLSDTLAELREGPWLRSGEKLLLVIDQFEQWLHGWGHDAITSLVDVMRQCDGGRIQALLLVRDDFWMPATRFFQQLDVPLVEGFNASAADLFDRAHATKVLAAFGVAYGRLEADPSKRPAEQQRFLERAVEELSVDGWIVPVRLCIFAEMVKSCPWSPATLRDVGGAQGLGTAFLEEVFDGRSASPMHRLHRKAARMVLERLLPPPGTDIRGHLVTESELQSISGYDQQPTEFAAFMRCLDHELRLITPSDTELVAGPYRADKPDGQSPPRLYQLTHDFLVTAIRGWLNQTRRRTIRGRAELRLAEYANAYSVRQESRQLPSWWDWVSLLILTRPRLRRPSEQVMMRNATRHHALRGGLVIAATVLFGSLVYNRMAAIRAEGLVQALSTSDSHDVPRVVDALKPSRSRVKPMLIERLSTEPPERDLRVRILLGLVAAGEPKVDELFDQLLDVEPPLAVAIAEVLLRYGRLEDLQTRLWKVAAAFEAAPARRLRACMALAKLTPSADADKWQMVANDLEAMLLSDVAENPGHFNTWVDGFVPVRQWLNGPLRKSFGDPELTEAKRLLAANVLARYAVKDVPQLVELALQAAPRQSDVFAKILKNHADTVRPDLEQVAKFPIPSNASEEDKDRLARRQANAIRLLRDFGQDQYLLPALEHRRDPRLRSFLLHYFREVPETPIEWMRCLTRERDAGIRQAIILVLGSAATMPLSAKQRTELTDVLLGIYSNDVDSGAHSAAQWALDRLGCDALLGQALAELSRLGLRPGYHWYVTKSKLSMIIFEPPGPVVLGSPESEPGRDASDEGNWACDIDWSFAVSATEITQAQYIAGFPAYKERFNEFAPETNCPANAVSWLDAARFCRELSQRDEVPETEMVIPPTENLKKGPYRDFRTHSGYRLPLESEWEVACRAGAVTSRFFGHAPDLLPLYCCYIGNSDGQSWTVASGWPNGAGVFDMLGNVSEWCYDSYVPNPRAADQPARVTGFSALNRYAVRGNDYSSNARMLRAANRRPVRPDQLLYSFGFRIAHTVRANNTTE